MNFLKPSNIEFETDLLPFLKSNYLQLKYHEENYGISKAHVMNFGKDTVHLILIKDSISYRLKSGKFTEQLFENPGAWASSQILRDYHNSSQINNYNQDNIFIKLYCDD